MPVITLVFKFVLKLSQPIKSDTLLFPPSLPVFGKHVLLTHTFIVQSEFRKDSWAAIFLFWHFMNQVFHFDFVFF